jgi:hypothetical protein
VLLGREETEDPEALVAGLERCRAEITGGRGPSRQTHRVPLFVEKVGFADGQVALDARVGGWGHATPMRFPATMLGADFKLEARARELVGKVFFARVNLGAEREPDLFFENIEAEFVDPEGLPLHFSADDK